MPDHTNPPVDRDELERQLKANQEEQTWLEEQLQRIEFALKEIEEDFDWLKLQLHNEKDHKRYVRFRDKIDHAKERVEEMGRHLRNSQLKEKLIRKKMERLT